MAEAPLVSVVAPAYGHEAYIEAALSSVADQTHGPIELIVIDDASRDATAGVAKAWIAANESRFTRAVFRTNRINRGAAFTLNRAIALATGQYLAILHTDDLYHPERIARLVQACEAAGADWAFSAVEPVDADGQAVSGHPFGERIAVEPAFDVAVAPSVSWAFLKWQIAVSTGNLFVLRALLQAAGPFAPLRYCHDWDMALRLCRRAEPAFVDEGLYAYRLHGSNTFESLADAAEAETRAVLSAFFRSVETRRPDNPLCPSPQGWPGTYEALLEALGVKGRRDALYDPYRPEHRTVRHATARGGARRLA